jgi:hypothetical protein
MLRWLRYYGHRTILGLRSMQRVFALSFLGVAMAASLLLSGPTPAGAATRGDANCSGGVDGQDALAILVTISGSPVNVASNCLSIGSNANGGILGDANCDRDIDALDVIDTLELAAGVAVAPCHSTTLANTGQVSQVVGTDGATLSTTGPDGSTYSLLVRADALTGEQLIQMTPLSAVSDLPLSGGFVAGLDLQPSGLLFWQPVTLTITPASSVSLGQESAFMITSGDLSLAPVLPQAGALQISLTHFTTVGVGSGSASDRQAITNSTPEGQFNDQIGNITHDERAGAPDPQQLIDAATAYYNTQIQPKLQLAATDCYFGRTFLRKALVWARQLQVLGAGNTFANQVQSVMQTYVNNLVTCYNDAAARCQQHDLTGLTDMLSYLKEITILGGEDQVDATKPDKCAHFRLEFDSDLCLSYVPVGLGSCPNALDVAYMAQDIDWGGILPSTPEAQGPMSLVKAVGPGSGATSSGSTFQVVTGGVYLNQIDQMGKVAKDPQVSMVIQPGQPIEHWTTSSGSFDASFWYNRFCAIHTGELLGHPNANVFTCMGSDIAAGNAQYNIGGWQVLGGELYAQKTYNRTYGGITTAGSDAEPQGGSPPDGWEKTTLKLYHEPQ